MTAQGDTPCILTGGRAGEGGATTSLAPAPVLTEGLTDHKFLLCLERNALGELWKVRTPAGRMRLAHLLQRSAATADDNWVRPLTILSHPALPPLEYYRTPSGQMVFMTDAPDKTFAEWFATCRREGRHGIPREDLLLQLRTLAEALDQLSREHRLQHLGLHPGCLSLKGGQALLGGLGLVQLLGPASGERLGALNPHYCAPELFADRPSPRSDQYSLALIYAELVSGVHPLGGGPGALRPNGAKRQGNPELSLLATADRKVIARALDPDPRLRFSSCRALVRALEVMSPPEDAALTQPPEKLSPLLVATGIVPVSEGVASLDGFIRQLLALATDSVAMQEYHTICYRLEPGENLRHHCAVSLFPGAAVLKLESFRQEWNAETVLQDREMFIFSVQTAPGFWQRLVGKQVGLEIQVRLTPPARVGTKLSDVAVVIRPFGCGRAQAVQLLAEMGPVLLESLRAHLQACSEQRAQERLVWNQPLRVIPVITGLKTAEPIECMGKDISARGIGFFLPKPLAATHVYVNHPSLPELASLAALAKVVRGQRGRDGWYEVGAQFAPEHPER